MACKYYYDSDGRKLGPVSANELVRLRAQGAIEGETWVRRENSSTWRPLSSVNLREAEEEEANPGVWRLLRRHFSLGSILLFSAVAVSLVFLLVGILSVAWPVVALLAILWLIARTFRSS